MVHEDQPVDHYVLVISWHGRRVHKGIRRIGDGAWWVTKCGTVGTRPARNGKAYRACKHCWPTH